MSSTTKSEEKPVSTSLEQDATHDTILAEEVDDSKFAQRTIRKIDLRILPLLCFIYTLACIDRSNISVARISGLDGDVGLDTGNRASIALLVFFVGYIVLEIPSNILITKIGVANWISANTIAFGAFTIGQGFVQNWVSLSILRAMLGACEAGVYPGMVYLITCWYRRYEIQKRLAFFFLAAQFLGSFGNILAYGLIQISRVHPEYKGWRWIYIVEGSITITVGIVSWFLIVDFPASNRTKFLDKEQKQFVLQRLQDDVGNDDKSPATWAVIWSTCLDWQIWSYSFMYMTGAIQMYSLAFFLPIILQNSLGFSQALSFILAAPPVMFAVLIGGFTAWLADRLHIRGPFVVALGILAIVGFCMLGFLTDPVPRYVGVFIGQAGAQGVVVTSLTWLANNIRNDAKRGVATAIIVMMSGVGGIYSSLVFRQQDAPGYIPGVIAVIAPSVVTICLALLTMFTLHWRNKEADQGERIIEGSEKFRYTL